MAPPNLTDPSFEVSCLRHSPVSFPSPISISAQPTSHHHTPHHTTPPTLAQRVVCCADALPPPPRAPLWPGWAAVDVLLFVCSLVLLLFFPSIFPLSCLVCLASVSCFFSVADMFALHLRAPFHVTLEHPRQPGKPPRRPRTACAVPCSCRATTLTSAASAPGIVILAESARHNNPLLGTTRATPAARGYCVDVVECPARGGGCDCSNKIC